MGNPKQVDQGGVTYIVEDVLVGATGPGQTGTSFASGDVEVSGTWTFPATGITIGETTLTEADLITLLA